MKPQTELFFPKEPAQALERLISELGFSMREPKALARSVKTLSDRYQETGDHSEIWQKSSQVAAYLSYFYPLNFLRSLAVIEEARRMGFFESLDSVIDLGSGAGNMEHALHLSNISFSSVAAIESSPQARTAHQRMNQSLGLPPPQFLSAVPQEISKKGLITASYALNELPLVQQESLLEKAEALLIIEPSTQQHGRRLMEWRQGLIDRGHTIWAPCTHQQACPLLSQSKKDWCHQRLFFETPSWLAAIESHLPMKNTSLTYSYLLVRKSPPNSDAHSGVARVIGDTLGEKGKTKQAVCQGPERQFLSWLKKDGRPPKIPRGSRIKIPAGSEMKGNEIRNLNDLLVLP